MTVFIACLIWVLWPLFAFGGGLALAPLMGLAGLLLLYRAVPAFRFRIYMIPLALFVAFALASSWWSPRPLELVGIDPAWGGPDFANEALRAMLLLSLGASLIAACGRLTPEGSAVVRCFLIVALLVQLVVCVLLSAFQEQALDLFAPIMATRGDGVQNISRNFQLMAMAAPFLIAALAHGRSPASGWIIAAGVSIILAIAYAFAQVDAGWLAIFAGWIAVLIVKVLPVHGFRVLSLMGAAWILAAPVSAWLVSSGIDQANVDDSLKWRLVIWDRTLDEIMRSPLIGEGLGVLRTIEEEFTRGPFVGEPLIPNHAHNMPLQLWAETGAAGAMLMAATLILAGWRMATPASLGRAGLQAAGLAGSAFAIASVSFDLWNEWWWSAVIILGAMTVAASRGRQVIQPNASGGSGST